MKVISGCVLGGLGGGAPVAEGAGGGPGGPGLLAGDNNTLAFGAEGAKVGFPGAGGGPRPRVKRKKSVGKTYDV